MLFLESASLYVDGRLLLNELSLSVNAGERSGIVGRNGSGKTHLLRLLSGDITPDSGARRLARGKTVLMVQQELPEDLQTPMDYLRSQDPDLSALDDEITQLETDSSHDVSERLGECYEKIAEIEAERYDQLAPQVLMGLGLSAEELELPMRNLSGGMRMRIGLAMALVRMPDVLLLDEPTNHLDLESTQWLIEYLKNYPSNRALVIVTHDIKLLREVCTTTMHLRGGTVTAYGGDFDVYREELQLKEEQDKASNEQSEKEIKRRMDTYYRFRDLPESRAAQAKGELRKAEDLKKKIVTLVQEEPVVELSFPEPVPVRDPMIRLIDASVGYGPKPVLQHLDLSIQFGAKIGVLGRNGEGKSTLIKLLADKLRVQAGDAERRPRLKISYFSQNLMEELDGSLTVYQQFAQKTGLTSDETIRSSLGRYGFSYDKVSIRVENLSGGEKSRLLFALICCNAPNLIIFDEPTNHLDIETRDSLAAAINNFPGSVILVSHDWDLHEKTMQQFWIVKEGTAKVYTKGLSHYKQQLNAFIGANLPTHSATGAKATRPGKSSDHAAPPKSKVVNTKSKKADSKVVASATAAPNSFMFVAKGKSKQKDNSSTSEMRLK